MLIKQEPFSNWRPCEANATYTFLFFIIGESFLNAFFLSSMLDIYIAEQNKRPIGMINSIALDTNMKKAPVPIMAAAEYITRMMVENSLNFLKYPAVLRQRLVIEALLILAVRYLGYDVELRMIHSFAAAKNICRG